MKYWLLTTEYPPSHGGGISTYCRCTAEMLAAREIMVTVVVCDDNVRDYTVESHQRNLLIVRFNPEKRVVPRELGGSAGLSYAYLKMLQQLAEDLGVPDVIESQDYLGIAYYLQQFKLLGYLPFAGVPVLITMHAPAFLYLPYNKVSVYGFPAFWTGEMEKQSIRAADLVVSPSQFLIGAVGALLDFGPVRPVLLPYAYEAIGIRAAVDATASPTALTPTFRTQPGITRNKIVYYGKLSPQKGSFELFEYFRELWEDGFPHTLHVIGGTDIVYHPEELTMGQVVARRYGAYIRSGLLVLHGPIRPAAIPAALADAHVILLPSIIDNLPFACLETMACGKVVLASVQGGQREIIRDGENGFLFDHTIAGDFGRKLMQVLALGDGDLERISSNAQQSINRYSYASIAPRKIALLAKLAGEHQPPAAFPFLWQEPVTALAEDVGIPGLLTVVIPFYNLGKYLDECIASVLASNSRRVEIIVVNDGSTDPKSLAVLEHWRDHPEVTVIDQINLGLATTRNAGARHAAGQYLAFLDADDQVEPDYYEKAIGVLAWYGNIHFVGCWARYFGGTSGIWPAFTPAPPYLLTHNSVNSSGLVYKTAAFLAAGLNDSRLEYGLEDYESVVSLVSHGFNGVVLPEALHRYRVRRGSMIRRMSRTKLLVAHDYIADKHRSYYQRFALDIIHLLNNNGPGYLYENPTTELYGRRNWLSVARWRHSIKRLLRKNRTLKHFLLAVVKKTEHIWQKQ